VVSGEEVLDPAYAAAVRELSDNVRRRWQAVDPLLPEPGKPRRGCGAAFRVSGPGGRPLAAASCEHWRGEPDSLDLTWGAARRFQLTAQVAAPDVAGSLDALLALWRRHLAATPDAANPDSAAVVTWPSRDIAGTATLLRHGYSPLAVIAARPAGARAGEPSQAVATPPGVRIRRAAPGDLDAMVSLGLEIVRFDAHFGGVQERPSTADALAAEFATLLAEQRPWMWLAELGSMPIGMLAAEPPDRAGWIAPMTSSSPVAYLLLMGARAGQRGHGIGAALAAELNATAGAASVQATLLHYAQLNPLSVPFWSQQGYRPLWTCWEARPAVS
jgi:hypothetical protein